MRLTSHYAYRIEHSATGRYYIGIRSCCCTPENDNYWGSGILIARFVAKFGPDAFKKQILAVFESRQEASKYEHDVVTLEMLSDPLCFNLTVGGDPGTIGRKHSDQTRLTMSASFTGRRYSQESRARMSAAAKGRKKSDEHRLNLSKALKKRWQSQEQRDQFVKSALSRAPVSAEARINMGNARRGRVCSAETRAKIGAKARERYEFKMKNERQS